MESKEVATELINKVFDCPPTPKTVKNASSDFGLSTSEISFECVNSFTMIKVREDSTNCGDSKIDLKMEHFGKNAVDEEAQFKAGDIFSDLLTPEELSQKLTVNETTQTSQSLGSYLVDATAQTSQGLLTDSTLKIFQGGNRTSLNAVKWQDSQASQDEQVVPEMTTQFFMPTTKSSFRKRRIGLSKRARLNPLHGSSF